MNHAAVLALLGDLYSQVTALQEQVRSLEAALSEKQDAAPQPPVA